MLIKWSNLANEFMLVYSVLDPEVIQLRHEFKLGYYVKVCSSSIDKLRAKILIFIYGVVCIVR